MRTGRASCDIASLALSNSPVVCCTALQLIPEQNKHPSENKALKRQSAIFRNTNIAKLMVTPHNCCSYLARGSSGCLCRLVSGCLVKLEVS